MSLTKSRNGWEGNGVASPSARNDMIPALQIAPALLYYSTLELTFLALRRHLFGTIALVRDGPREQVSGGLLIKTQTLTAIGG